MRVSKAEAGILGTNLVDPKDLTLDKFERTWIKER